MFSRRTLTGCRVRNETPYLIRTLRRHLSSTVEDVKEKKTCTLRKQYKMMYDLRNRERIKQYRTEYLLKNKEQRKQYQLIHQERTVRTKKEYYRKNQEKVKKYQKEYDTWNCEKKKLYQKVYRSDNPEKVKQYKRTYSLLFREYLKLRAKQEKMRENEKQGLPPPIFNKFSWRTVQNARRALDFLASELHVSSIPNDWCRVSLAQLKSVGGSGYRNRFKNLGHVLSYAYPEFTWDIKAFSRSVKKSMQRWLLVMFQQLLPKTETKIEVFEDYLHPELFWQRGNERRMQLDIWIPKYNLALEYQGEQHYYDLPQRDGPGTVLVVWERDRLKTEACEKKGILLVQIPYWWDKSKESLSSTLHLVLPKLFADTKSPPIPIHPPHSLMDNRRKPIEASLMHGNEFQPSLLSDPTGWYISEKFDGVRALWNGSAFISKNGNVIAVPSSFTKTLPSNVVLDGELW
eukprot:TRINITY_DN2152_c0_g1_i5.p1 TRINITY_DN2152_c0_g1~~TRINITY_DN2152_c0_g1_i5.p1  ORF type:complete len:459 (-),score=79.09 TRINITY_DN2152_c0_g1_i5:847-2223(-)